MLPRTCSLVSNARVPHVRVRVCVCAAAAAGRAQVADTFIKLRGELGPHLTNLETAYYQSSYVVGRAVDRAAIVPVSCFTPCDSPSPLACMHVLLRWVGASVLAC